jgi:hypothetical protein
MTSAAKRDEKKQMDQDPTGLDTGPDKPQNQKHHKSGPEHLSLLSRYSLQTFSFRELAVCAMLLKLGVPSE